MTVAELIAKLQEMPQDARVVRESHYGGLDGIAVAKVVPIVVCEHLPGESHGGYREWEEWMEKPSEGMAAVIR